MNKIPALLKIRFHKMERKIVDYPNTDKPDDSICQVREY